MTAVASAVPVSVHGITVTSVLVGLLNILVGGVLVSLVKSRPVLRKIANEREANLLTERAHEMEQMRARLAKLEAERARDRHRINNLTSCLDALVMMIELEPGKAREAAARVKAMRADQIKAEAAEAGAIHAASITGASDDAA